MLLNVLDDFLECILFLVIALLYSLIEDQQSEDASLITILNDLEDIFCQILRNTIGEICQDQQMQGLRIGLKSLVVLEDVAYIVDAQLFVANAMHQLLHILNDSLELSAITDNAIKQDIRVDLGQLVERIEVHLRAGINQAEIDFVSRERQQEFQNHLPNHPNNLHDI